jgi:serine/threonine protein kinase
MRFTPGCDKLIIGTCPPSYQAPEGFLGLCKGPASDIWSAGCIFLEMKTRKHPFETNQTGDERFTIIFKKIFSMVPFPNLEEWKRSTKQGLISEVETRLSEHDFTSINISTEERGFELLTRLLEPDQKKRITAKRALEYSVFKEEKDVV